MSALGIPPAIEMSEGGPEATKAAENILHAI